MLIKLYTKDMAVNIAVIKSYSQPLINAMTHTFCRFNFSRLEWFSIIRKAMVHKYFSYI